MKVAAPTGRTVERHFFNKWGETDGTNGRSTAKTVMLVFATVLFFLVVYLFNLTGFVVTAVPLFIGGTLCKMIAVDILIGCAILRGMINRNKREEAATFM